MILAQGADEIMQQASKSDYSKVYPLDYLMSQSMRNISPIKISGNKIQNMFHPSISQNKEILILLT